MIVISGVLLLVAVVLLVIGLITTPLAWVYASIAVSVVSFVFLLLGVRQRREMPAPADRPDVTPAPAGRLSTLAADDSDVTVVPAVTEAPAAAPPQRAAVAVVDEPEVASAVAEDEVLPVGADASTAAGPVLVVPGRPRYHVAGCRYLSGRDVEARSLEDARSEGFTACGVCRPEEALGAGGSDELPTQELAAADELTPAPVDLGEAADRAETEDAPAVPARRPRAAATKTAPAKAAAATSAPAKRPAAKSAVAKGSPATSTAAKSAKAAAPRKQEKVVVIPDRDKYHLATCRFVRDLPASETEELTKTVARREGYEPCGVCKP